MIICNYSGLIILNYLWLFVYNYSWLFSIIWLIILHYLWLCVYNYSWLLLIICIAIICDYLDFWDYSALLWLFWLFWYASCRSIRKLSFQKAFQVVGQHSRCQAGATRCLELLSFLQGQYRAASDIRFAPLLQLPGS